MNKENDCCEENQHPDHSKELSRINRIAGQIEGVRKMIVDRRYCPDILTQLRAARSAIHAVEAEIIGRHLDSCIMSTFRASDDLEKEQKIAELKNIYKRFDL